MTATAQKPTDPAGNGKPVPSPTIPVPKKPKLDPRYVALRNFAISISVFNAFGYTVLGFEQPWLWPFIAVLTGYTTEIVFEMISAWANKRAPRFTGNGMRGLYEFLLPAHITALAVNMLLYGNNQLWPVLFGVFCGVAAKHALQAPIAGRMRHYMNPSNFGIAMALVCFGSWVSIAPPYEFTEEVNVFWRVMIPVIIATAGTVINGVLTKRVALIVGWMGGFAIQAIVRHWIWDVSIYTALGVMSGVAFILFTNYMITDPGTTPTKSINQFMFGSGVAFVYGFLMIFNVVYTLFFATAIVCALRGLYWWGAHLRGKAKQPRTVTEAEQSLTTTEPAMQPAGHNGSGVVKV